MKKSVICTECPKGCEIVVTISGKAIQSMEGFSCPKGSEYAKNEILAPVRFITSTIPTTGLALNMIPVKTSMPIPKDRIFDVMREVRSTRISDAVTIGDVIIKNVAGLDVNIVATRSNKEEVHR